MKPEVLTFDCYGTLIDWKQGISDTARPSAQKIDADRFFDIWWRIDRELTVDHECRPYREILKRTYRRAFQAVGVDVSEAEAIALKLRDWPLFPEANRSLAACK